MLNNTLRPHHEIDGGVYIARCSDCGWYSASGCYEVTSTSREYHARAYEHDVYLEIVLDEG
jgi:hypothetical protein